MGLAHLFALGHMMFGYLFVRLFDRAFKTHTPTWLALTVGLIPDADLYFASLGLEHHTITHSILFWLPLIPLVYYKRQYIPSYVGILQHMLDDMLVDTVPLFLPLSTVSIGLDLGAPSVWDTLLECSALLVVAIVAYANGDLREMYVKNLSLLKNAVPLVLMVSLTLIASNEFKVQLVKYAVSSQKLTLISIGHVVVGGALAVSVLQGLRALLTKT
jgi:hypothetical protein